MDLPFVMGTELTGIHSRYNERVYMRWDSFIQNRKDNDVYSIGRRLNTIHTGVYGLGFDGHCVEVSSPKLKTFEAYRSFSKNVRTVLANHDYHPKNQHAVCGGGHIHVGVPKNPWGAKFRYHVARDLIMRPYLPWIFGEPDEEGAMNVFINKQEKYWEMERIWNIRSGPRVVRTLGLYQEEEFIKHLSIPYNPRTRYMSMSNLVGKTYMYTLTYYPTIEFRFFEMAPDWEEQELHMNFLVAYLKWMVLRLENDDYTPIRLITDKDMQAIEPGICEDLFEEMCQQIGVDYSDYEHIVERNLYPRWTNGRKRV